VAADFYQSNILVDAQIGKIYLDMALGGIIGEEEEYHGLA